MLEKPYRLWKFAFGSPGRVGVVKHVRAWGGCLGVIRHTGVEGCEMSGEAAQRALIPEYLL
jgi:hypothetical protein